MLLLSLLGKRKHAILEDHDAEVDLLGTPEPKRQKVDPSENAEDDDDGDEESDGEFDYLSP